MATILCIEDEADLREVIVEVLEDTGYGVLQASDGEEGLEAILEHKPDLVICDITMPKKDGNQLLQELRGEHKKLDDMPFIFLSALSGEQQVLAGLRHGADDYLSKPVSFELLKTKIATSLRQMDRMKQRKQEERKNLCLLDF